MLFALGSQRGKWVSAECAILGEKQLRTNLEIVLEFADVLRMNKGTECQHIRLHCLLGLIVIPCELRQPRVHTCESQVVMDIMNLCHSWASSIHIL